jgi:hypothetical protein
MECAYLLLCGRHMECAYYIDFGRLGLLQPCFHFVFDLVVIDLFMGEE